MSDKIEESSPRDPTVYESLKESFSDVKYEEAGKAISVSCEFLPETVVTSRKGPFGDTITVNKSFNEAVDVAQLLLRLEQETSLKKMSSYYSITDQQGSQLTYFDLDSVLLLNSRRHFTCLNGMKVFECGTARIPAEKQLAEFKTELTFQPYSGSFPTKTIMTNYRLIFIPTTQPKKSFKAKIRSDTFIIPMSMIEKVDKHSDRKNPSLNYVDIGIKDGRMLRIAFTYDEYSGYLKFSDMIDKLSYTENITDFFAFKLFEQDPSFEHSNKGWSLYDIDKDFARQGIDLSTQRGSEAEEFVYKKVQNKHADGMICDTYPAEFVVPSQLEESELMQCSKFRSRQRLPVLVYFYRGSDHDKFATLWRSSQCHSGWYESRSAEDEHMVRLIGDPTVRNPIDSQGQQIINVHIYDARPYLSAVANKVHGKGYENTNNYKNAEIFFMEIPNIHVVRDSYKKLITAVSKYFRIALFGSNQIFESLDNDKFSSIIDSSNWLLHISAILTAARSIVERSLKQGFSVLVHCSDGWDRTAQITSLTQLMIDPYYRSLEGFEVLIEKDWVSYGHQFRLRHGLRNKDEKDQRAPVFLQFLDCVHQLCNQFPYAFEFNLRFLSDLAYFSHTTLFGTFLCDRQEEMLKLQINKKTISIWSFLNSRRKIYSNYLYDPSNPISAMRRIEILPNPSTHAIRFWREHYLYYYDEVYLSSFNEIEVGSKWDLYDLSLEHKKNQLDKTHEENNRLRKMLATQVHEIKALKQQLEGRRESHSGKESPTESAKIKESEFELVEDDENLN